MWVKTNPDKMNTDNLPKTIYLSCDDDNLSKEYAKNILTRANKPQPPT
jgi:hypothetical protein